MKNNSAEENYKRFRRLSVWLALTAVLAVIALAAFICAFAVAALAAYKTILMTVSGITVGVAVLSMVFLGVAISMLPTFEEPENADSIDISAENIDTDGSTFASNAVVPPQNSTKPADVQQKMPDKRAKAAETQEYSTKPAKIKEPKPDKRAAKAQENYANQNANPAKSVSKSTVLYSSPRVNDKESQQTAVQNSQNVNNSAAVPPQPAQKTQRTRQTKQDPSYYFKNSPLVQNGTVGQQYAPQNTPAPQQYSPQINTVAQQYVPQENIPAPQQNAVQNKNSAPQNTNPVANDLLEKYAGYFAPIAGVSTAVRAGNSPNQSGAAQQDATPPASANAQQYTEYVPPLTDVHAAPRVNYIPSQNVYDFVNVGKVQRVEEKFDQIGKMDQAQFVIYFAKLFSLKGYNVKLTPVADNFGIDMLVEKSGVPIAVSCVRSQIVLSADALKAAVEGRNHYGTYHAMVLTNTFFDRSAVELAKKEGLSLVDREVLIDEFL
jgi:HJR/Mrr/RecB family endonuclease